jgi:hypothetical protein
MNPPADLFAMARAALGASTTSEDTEIATFYCASARLSVQRAKAELAEIERVLIARERELGRRATPKQLAIAEGDRP